MEPHNHRRKLGAECPHYMRYILDFVVSTFKGSTAGSPCTHLPLTRLRWVFFGSDITRQGSVCGHKLLQRHGRHFHYNPVIFLHQARSSQRNFQDVIIFTCDKVTFGKFDFYGYKNGKLEELILESLQHLICYLDSI